MRFNYLSYLQAKQISMLFILGGNGTHAGGKALHEEVVNCNKSIIVKNQNNLISNIKLMY